MAKLAETPPMVGSVSTEMYGRPRSCIFASAAEVFAICIRDISASCIRAPPEAEKQISGQLSSSACSTARTKRAPTTEPIEPPIKENSNAAATTGISCRVPFMTISASFSPVSFCAEARRSLYFLESRNLSTSFGSSSLPSSTREPSSSRLCRRLRADIRIWWSHFGHTSRLRSSSARYRTWPQLSHFVHTPSGMLALRVGVMLLLIRSIQLIDNLSA